MRTSLRVLAWVAIGGGVLAVAGNASDQRTARPVTRPTRVVQEVEVEFPVKLRNLGYSHGEVDVLLDIDAAGTLQDHLIVAYTHYEFANEVSRVLGRWRYEAAVIDGVAVASTVRLQITFGVNGMLVVDKRAPGKPPEPGEFMFRARELRELDAMPKPLVRVSPRNPTPITESTTLTGRVRVEFYIDEEGAVRMPTVVTADHERLGWAALGAIAKWKFEIPRRGGYPVLVRAQQDFIFDGES